MQEKFKEFWLEKDKEEIIEAYGACIHNGEVLLARIDKAIEYTKQFTNGKTSSIDEWKNVELVLETILEILKGEK